MPSAVLTASQNTFVSSAQPNNNFSFYPVLYTGTDTGFGNCISLLKFDFTTVPANAVDSAELQLSVIVKSGGKPGTVAVNRVTDYFDITSVTYKDQPAIEATGQEVLVTAHDLYTTLSIDVTELVNDWLSGTYINHGIALTTTDAAVQFGSDKIVWEPYFPKLELNYPSPQIIVACPFASLCTIEGPGDETEENYSFDMEELISEISQISGGEYVEVTDSGTYAVWFKVSSELTQEFTLYRNGKPAPAEVSLPAAAGGIGVAVIDASAGDKLSVKPLSGPSDVQSCNCADERNINTNSSIFVVRIGPGEQERRIREPGLKIRKQKPE